MKKANLVGEHFGKLEVIAYDCSVNGKSMWKCRCECGNETIVSTNNLRSGNTKSCGKCVKKNRFEDLTGQTFGYWKVLGLHEDKGYTRTWMCHCTACDSVDRPVSAKNLKSGASQSCGCTHSNKDIIKNRIEDNLVGKKFGRLTVLEYAGDNKWKCECDCKDKNIVYTTSQRLKSGHTRSCGCLRNKGIGGRALPDGCDLTNMRFGNLLVKYDTLKRNSSGEILWHCVCDCGNEKDISGYRLRHGDITDCGHNNIAVSGSFAENEIKDYIESMGYKTEKDRTILNGKEIDILVVDKKIGIEFNGSIYHACLGNVYEDKPVLYHQEKFLNAKEKGIHLISIFDVDWQNNQDRIKMYLRSLLSPQKELMARKLEVHKVDNNIACDFVNKYHIQGANKAMMKINYGLYYNNELYAVMSFGKLRLSKTEDGEYELHRYCVKDGYKIVGGANKLLKHFERDYSPKYLLSYSDNDYFTGAIYPRLGFGYSGQSRPRYYWYLNGQERKRESCMLKRLKVECPDLLQEAYDNEAPNKESYVMLSRGACKVYRSGNTKWEKFYKA